MTDRERLVSTTLLTERIEELEAEVEEQRKTRADTDPFFKIADWLLAEWRKALRDAEREYVTTAEASRLTGWSDQTLRQRAREAAAGAGLPDGWEELRARKDGTDWSFCVSTIPVKGQAAA